MKRLFLLISILSILTFFSVLVCGSAEGMCSVISEHSFYIGSASLHLAMISLAFFFLWKKDLRSMLESIGFPGDIKKNLIYSAITLVSIFAVLLILGMVSLFLGFNDQQKVSEKITSLPFAVLLFAAFGAPISEELFFRGFLTSRVGVLASSLLFGAMHLAYGSTVEILGAFLIGIILALAFKLSKSITPCIVAHMAYNAMAITVMVLFT
jgi:hypothetical protein